MVSVGWKFVSLRGQRSLEGDPAQLQGSLHPPDRPQTPPSPSDSATVVAQKPSPLLVPIPAGPSSLSYQLCSQLPGVRQEGAGQEDGAVQLSPRVWGGPWGARRWPWGSSSIWPQAQSDQDQAANTWGREEAESSDRTGGSEAGGTGV